MARMWAGVLPQHAPMIRAPIPARAPHTPPYLPGWPRRRFARLAAGARRHSLWRPAAGLHLRRCILVIAASNSSGPLPQLAPSAVTSNSLRVSSACSGLTPIIVRPLVSNVMVVMIGISGAARRQPSTAARTSSRSDMVSIHSTVTPPSTNARTCSS